jgi:hypothetical protein
LTEARSPLQRQEVGDVGQFSQSVDIIGLSGLGGRLHELQRIWHSRITADITLGGGVKAPGGTLNKLSTE